MTEYSALSHTGFLNNKSKSITVSLVQTGVCQSLYGPSNPHWLGKTPKNPDSTDQATSGSLNSAIIYVSSLLTDEKHLPQRKLGLPTAQVSDWDLHLHWGSKMGREGGRKTQWEGAMVEEKKSVITGGNEGICLLPGFFVASWQTHIGWKKVYNIHLTHAKQFDKNFKS